MTEQEEEEEHRPFGFAQDRLKPVLLGGRAGPSGLRMNWKPALPRTPTEPDYAQFVMENCGKKKERSPREALFSN